MQKYFARAGSIYTDTDAEVVGPELEELALEENLTPAAVVHKASTPTSQLHPYVFRLNSDEAAQQHYLSVARGLIRSIEIHVEIPETGTTERVRAFCHVKEKANTPAKLLEYGPSRGVYKPIRVVLQRPAEWEQVLDKMYARMLSFKREWEKYQRLFDGVDDPRYLAVSAAISAVETPLSTKSKKRRK